MQNLLLNINVCGQIFVSHFWCVLLIIQNGCFFVLFPRLRRGNNTQLNWDIFFCTVKQSEKPPVPVAGEKDHSAAEKNSGYHKYPYRHAPMTEKHSRSAVPKHFFVTVQLLFQEWSVKKHLLFVRISLTIIPQLRE